MEGLLQSLGTQDGKEKSCYHASQRGIIWKNNFRVSSVKKKSVFLKIIGHQYRTNDNIKNRRCVCSKTGETLRISFIRVTFIFANFQKSKQILFFERFVYVWSWASFENSILEGRVASTFVLEWCFITSTLSWTITVMYRTLTLEELNSDTWVTYVCRTTCCEPGVQVVALYHRDLCTSLSYLTGSIKLAHVLLRYHIGGLQYNEH